MTGQGEPAEGRASRAAMKNSFLFVGWVSKNRRLYKESIIRERVDRKIQVNLSKPLSGRVSVYYHNIHFPLPKYYQPLGSNWASSQAPGRWETSQSREVWSIRQGKSVGCQ